MRLFLIHSLDHFEKGLTQASTYIELSSGREMAPS